MAESVDWSLTTFEGNRRRQHLEFLQLPFREKLLVIERLGEVAALLTSARDTGQTLPVSEQTRDGNPR